MFIRSLKSWRDDRSAGVAIEYAMIAVLVAVVIVAATVNLGGAVKGNFETVSDAVDGS